MDETDQIEWLKSQYPEAFERLLSDQSNMQVCTTIDEVANVIGWPAVESFLRYEGEQSPPKLKKEVLDAEVQLLQKRMGSGVSYDAILLTVGTSIGPIILTIEAFRPGQVCLLPTLDTRSEAEEVRNGLSYGATVDIEVIDGTDTGSLYKNIIEKVRYYRKLGLQEIAIDGTGGKKSMSQAAAIAAEFLEIDLLYVNAVMKHPATQKIVVLPRPETLFGDRSINQIVDTINSGHYKAARKMCDDLLERVRGISVNKVKVLRSTAFAFEHCEIGAFEKAIEMFSEMDRDLRQGDLWWTSEDVAIGLERIRHYCDDIGDIGQALSDFEQLAKMDKDADEDSKVLEMAGLFQELHLEERLLRVIGFLLASAEREAENGRFDMASLLLYRSLELGGQTMLSVQSVFPFGNLRMSSSTRSLTAGRFSALKREIMKKALCDDVFPEKIALMDGLILAKVLLGQDYDEKGRPNKKVIGELKGILGTTESRNTSRLAHGLNVIEHKDYSKFFETVCRFLEAHGLRPDPAKYEFPQIGVPESVR